MVTFHIIIIKKGSCMLINEICHQIGVVIILSSKYKLKCLFTIF